MKIHHGIAPPFVQADPCWNRFDYFEGEACNPDEIDYDDVDEIDERFKVILRQDFILWVDDDEWRYLLELPDGSCWDFGEIESYIPECMSYPILDGLISDCIAFYQGWKREQVSPGQLTLID